MASPPNPNSPAGMSPPFPSPAQLPNKKRTANFEGGAPPIKRRKPSSMSQPSSGLSHPLRQASFPTEARSPYARSPSVDTTSIVSGSAVSAAVSGAPGKKKRGRKAKNAKNGGDSASAVDGTPSVASGKATTALSGQGDKEGDDEEDDDKAEMALEDMGTRTQAQKQEERRLRAMLVDAFDTEQYDRYEMWRAAKLSDAVVKRVVNATVSQSVPQMVSTAVKAVAKLFAGEIIEAARNVQGEWIAAGEKQTDLPTPPSSNPEIGASQDGKDGEREDASSTQTQTQTQSQAQAPMAAAAAAAEPLRGPLRPDHLREAWRRYRISGESKGVGVQQLWHAQQRSGVDRYSTRTGRRIFQ